MNFSRAIKLATDDSLPNLIIKLSYADHYPDNLHYVDFPIDLGIVGYRVSFVSELNKARLAAIDSFEKLKQLSVGQGHGWSDVGILRDNGFKVFEASNYQGLFPMVAANRFDFFPRGINEFLGEWYANKNIENLTYDQTFALYYPLPRFFYSHKNNKAGLARIKKGLEISYADGSLMELWRENYQQSIDFVKLKERRVYKINNPTLGNIDTSYEKYLYDPYK